MIGRRRRTAGVIAGLAFVLTIGSEAGAQGTHALHRMPVIPADLLVRPIAIRSGIGVAHDTVATTSPDAQRFYDQGLSYLHNYVWIEAARSFNQAVRLDARSPMAYIGLSLALTGLNQRAAARDAFERARSQPLRGEHERRHLVVRERQVAAEQAPGDAGALAAYRAALDEALKQFPEDVELWLQRGVAEATNAADRGQGSPSTAVPYFEKVFALAPDHFAAHHYLTHAYENSGKVQDALAHGAAYARLAREVPHARHMYGHDLRRVGRIREAILEFAAADRLETAFFAADQVSPDNDWHFEHNLELMGTSYQYTGQLRRAAPLLEKAFGLSTANLVQAVNKRQWPAFLRARGELDRAIAAARLLGGHPNGVVQAMGRIEAARALLAGGHMTEAAAEANAARSILNKGEPGAALASTEMQLLQGEFFLRTAQRDKGREMLLTALARARAAPGPDEWTQALFTLESIATAARDAGDWDLAGQLARQMIDHDRAYAGSHYALGLVAERSGDGAAASRAFSTAVRLWSEADADLPQLVDARKRVQGLK
jgi:tetratricopeptide (TPR) repeat protein